MSLELAFADHERGIDLRLEVGNTETVAVMGPNGAGKSTLLHVLAGLHRPDIGRGQLDGRLLFDVDGRGGHWTAPQMRRVGLLAQDPLLFPHLDAVDNVAFGPRSAGATRAASRKLAAGWLAQVDAADLSRRRPFQLSGGQAQRVGVARALAAEPDLLLLDEPLAALDQAAAPLIRRLLKQVLGSRPSVIVTHDVLDALLLADRIVILENGRISEQGPTDLVLERPRSRFAAGLAGLNLLHGIVGGPGLEVPDGSAVAGIRDESAAEGEAAVALFRPADVAVFRDRPAGSPRNCFAVTITDVEPRGDQLRAHAGHLAADVTPSALAELDLAPGAKVHFVVKAAAVKVYPAKQSA